HHALAAQLLANRARLVGVGGHSAARRRDAVAAKDLLRLVLVDLHVPSLERNRPGGGGLRLPAPWLSSVQSITSRHGRQPSSSRHRRRRIPRAERPPRAAPPSPPR